jgi:5-methylcytosine-specific restriction protein A
MTRLKTLRPSVPTLGTTRTSTEPRPLWTPDAKRGSRQARGYGAAWEQLRKEILDRDNGLCQPHLKLSIVRIGNQVDHITSKAEARAKGWTDQQIEHPSNLQTICKDCHDAKSRAEMTRGRGA